MSKRKPRRMTKINLDEVSGVGRPAHQQPGFAVMKSADTDRVAQLLGVEARKADDVEEEEERDGKKRRKPYDDDDDRTNKEHGMPETPKIELTADAIAKALADDKTLAEQVAEQTSGDDVLKGLPEDVRKQIEDARDRAERAEKAAQEERDSRLDAEAVRKARDDYASLAIDPAEIGPAMRKLAEHNEGLAKQVESALKAANAQAAQVEDRLFKEVGYGDGSDDSSAPGDRLDAMAKARAEEKGEDYAAAYAEVLKTEEGSRLYKSYTDERTTRLG